MIPILILILFCSQHGGVWRVRWLGRVQWVVWGAGLAGRRQGLLVGQRCDWRRDPEQSSLCPLHSTLRDSLPDGGVWRVRWLGRVQWVVWGARLAGRRQGVLDGQRCDWRGDPEQSTLCHLHSTLRESLPDGGVWRVRWLGRVQWVVWGARLAGRRQGVLDGQRCDWRGDPGQSTRCHLHSTLRDSLPDGGVWRVRWLGRVQWVVWGAGLAGRRQGVLDGQRCDWRGDPGQSTRCHLHSTLRDSLPDGGVWRVRWLGRVQWVVWGAGLAGRRQGVLDGQRCDWRGDPGQSTRCHLHSTLRDSLPDGGVWRVRWLGRVQWVVWGARLAGRRQGVLDGQRCDWRGDPEQSTLCHLH